MQIAFLLPSIVYGGYLATTTGNWALLVLSGGSLLVWWVFGNNQRLQGEVSFDNDRVFVGRKRLHRFVFLWPAGLRDRVFEAVFVPRESSVEDFEKLAKRKQWFLGLSAEQEVVLPVGSKGHHCLVIGPTGSGKTELLRNLAMNFDGDLIAVDFKGGLGLAPLNPVRILTNHNQEPEEFWNFISVLLDAREQSLIENSNPSQLLLMVDELALVLYSSLQAQKIIERVVSKGRSLGVVLVAASQTLSGISRTVMANCTLRIAVGAIDTVDLAQLGITQKSAAHNPVQGFASLIVDGTVEKFQFSPLWKGAEKEMAPTETVSANPLLARFAPMHESIHL